MPGAFVTGAPLLLSALSEAVPFATWTVSRKARDDGPALAAHDKHYGQLAGPPQRTRLAAHEPDRCTDDAISRHHDEVGDPAPQARQRPSSPQADNATVGRRAAVAHRRLRRSGGRRGRCPDTQRPLLRAGGVWAHVPSRTS